MGLFLKCLLLLSAFTGNYASRIATGSTDKTCKEDEICIPTADCPEINAEFERYKALRSPSLELQSKLKSYFCNKRQQREVCCPLAAGSTDKTCKEDEVCTPIEDCPEINAEFERYKALRSPSLELQSKLKSYVCNERQRHKKVCCPAGTIRLIPTTTRRSKTPIRTTFTNRRIPSGTKYVMGGSKLGNRLNSVERYTETGWSKVQPMPTPRNRLTVAVQDNLLYAIGGINKDQDGELNTVEMYNPRSGQWTNVSSMNTRRVMHGAAAMGGLVYVVGGWGGGNDLDTVESYNVTSGQWEYGTSMTQPRASPGVVELGGRIYAIGGWNGVDGYLNNVEFMDKDTGVWSPAPSMNTNRSGPGAATLNTKIYVAGGYDGGSYLPSVEMFDPIENVWKNVASMRVARVGPALASMGGKIWAMGGEGDGRSALSSVEIYSPETDTWEDVDNMESCAGLVAAGVLNT